MPTHMDDEDKPEMSNIIISDKRKRIEMTDTEVKQFINAITLCKDDLAYEPLKDAVHFFKYEFGAICWWLGKCRFLQFIDTLPSIPVLSRDKNVAWPDIYAIFSNKGRLFPCFIVIASFDKTGQLTIYRKYLSRLNKYPLIQDHPVLIAARHDESWYLFNIESYDRGEDRIIIDLEDAEKGNIMGILCGDARFDGLREGTSWYYTIETKEDMELVKQGIIPLNDPITGMFMENAHREELDFTPLMLHMLPFFGTWKSFERYGEEVVYSGAALTESRPLHLYQILTFTTRFVEYLVKNRAIEWNRILQEKKFPYKVEEVRSAMELARDRGLGFEGFEHYLPEICLPDWMTDE